MQVWWLQKIHVSWLIASWCLGVVCGVVVTMFLPYGLFSGMAWVLVGLALLVPLVREKLVWMIGLACLSGLFVGLWRGGVGQVGLEHYEELLGRQVVISGRVTEDPDLNKRGQTVLRLTNIIVQEQSLPGSVWVTTDKSQVIKRSDRVTVSGKASDGFGAFAIGIYDAKVLGVERPVPGDVADGIRDWFAKMVRLHIDEPQADLGLGFLLGLRRALPVDLMDALQIAGLTHVIVASGYNLTILVRISRRLFTRVSKYLSMLSSVAMIIGFIAVSGMSSSMSRAGLVAGLSLAAWYYGRNIHPLVLLPLAAAITLLISPQYGWNDLGWQLSFVAFAGVIILAPILQKYFFGDKEPGNIRQILGETISAQLVTLPLLVMSFGVMSNVAVVANLLILPFVPLAMLLTFLTGVLATIPLVGAFVGTLTTWLLGYMVVVAEILAGQPWSRVEISISWWHVAVVYVLIGLVIWHMKRVTGFTLRKVNIVE